MIAGIPPRRAWAEDRPPSATNPSGPSGPSDPTNPPGAPNETANETATTPATETPPPDATGGAKDAEPPRPPPPSPPAPPPPRLVASLSHDLQFGLAVMLGDGYRGVFPYDGRVDCGDAKAADARVCTNRAPVFVDVQPSYGLSNSWDFLVDLRFGLVADFNTYRQFYVMPGFRYWLDWQTQVKFFTTLQLAYDVSKQNSPPGPAHVGDNDLGFRNSNGLMFEVMRNFGVYVQFGETIGFVRWLSFLVDAGVGVQARVP